MSFAEVLYLLLCFVFALADGKNETQIIVKRIISGSSSFSRAPARHVGGGGSEAHLPDQCICSPIGRGRRLRPGAVRVRVPPDAPFAAVAQMNSAGVF